MSNLTAISLFSGMGGDTLGMENAGVNVIAFSEKIPIIRDTHLEIYKLLRCVSRLLNTIHSYHY